MINENSQSYDEIVEIKKHIISKQFDGIPHDLRNVNKELAVFNCQLGNYKLAIAQAEYYLNEMRFVSNNEELLEAMITKIIIFLMAKEWEEAEMYASSMYLNDFAKGREDALNKRELKFYHTLRMIEELCHVIYINPSVQLEYHSIIQLINQYLHYEWQDY